MSAAGARYPSPVPAVRGRLLLYAAIVGLHIAPVPAGAAEPVQAKCAPEGDLRGDPRRGAILHLKHCAECHGADGKAEVIVMHMDVQPRDQSDAAYMRTLPDAYLYLAICRGGGEVGKYFVMPGWGDVLSDRDIRDLLAHIRTFSAT
jgi:mono/diheme cytochrome c family protein